MTWLRRNAIANLAGRAVTGVLWVAVTPYVLSRLGAERFGIWSLFFTFLSYLLAFDLGISSTMTRFVASARGAGESQSLLRTLRRGLMLAIGLGLLWAAVVVLARPWIVHVFRVPPSLIPETQQALVMFAAAVLILFPTQVMMGSLQGFGANRSLEPLPGFRRGDAGRCPLFRSRDAQWSAGRSHGGCGRTAGLRRHGGRHAAP